MDLSGLQQQARAAAPEPTTFSAQVVRADESGLWVAIIGDDVSSPIGPCKGGWTANGTRVPPGALVALVMTDDGPWAIGVDNPALAINDGTLAPFHNPSFELLDSTTNTGAAGWNYFQLFGDVSTREVITAGGAAHGQRHLRVTKNAIGGAFIQSTPWSVVAGSSLEISYYGREVAGQGRISPYIFTTAPGQGEPTILNPNNVSTLAAVHVQSTDWLRYRATVTLPPTHTRVCVVLRVDSEDGNPTTVDLDNVDADLATLDASVAHQDYIRRASATLLGGGTRQVTAGGNVSWSQPFTIAGAGLRADEAPDGRFAVLQPPNGTVIPVHTSAARTTHTVAGGVITLNADDALWYELPIAAAATSQPARFHIIGSSSADNFAPAPHWILIVRRASAWSPTSHAPEYVWGDGMQHDPWRTPSFNSGWSAGTVAPRYRKDDANTVRIRGRVAGGAGSAFTLPDGYWPASTHADIVRDGAGAAAGLTVTTAGVVTTAGNASDHSVNTTFTIDP